MEPENHTLFRIVKENHIVYKNGKPSLSPKAFNPDDLPNKYCISVDQQEKSNALRFQYPNFYGEDAEISFQVFKQRHPRACGVAYLPVNSVDPHYFEIQDDPVTLPPLNASHANIFFHNTWEKHQKFVQSKIDYEQIQVGQMNIDGVIRPIERTIAKRIEPKPISVGEKRRDLCDAGAKLFKAWEKTNQYPNEHYYHMCYKDTCTMFVK